MRKIILKVRSATVIDTRHKKYATTLGRDCNKIQSSNDMEHLVHKNHISNMLHVLLGARPVSARKNPFTFRERSAYIDNIADNALFRFDSPVTYTANGGERLLTTTIQGRKAFKDSNRKVVLYSSNFERSDSYLTWDKLEERSVLSLQYEDALNVLKDFATSIGCQTKDYTLMDFLIKMRDYPEWVEKLNNIKDISPILNFLNQSEKSNNGLTNVKSPNYAGLANTIYPVQGVRFDATIIIFMTDEDAMNLLNGKRNATFLDMGCVSLKGNPSSLYDLEYIDENTIEEYKQNYVSHGFMNVKKFPLTEKTLIHSNS